MVDRRTKSWDITINPNEKVDMAVESGYVFHITKIKLESMVKNGKEANEVSVGAIFDGRKLDLGPLSSGKPEKVFDIELYGDKVQLLHNWTDGRVKFFGYYHEKAVMTSEHDDKDDLVALKYFVSLKEDEDDIILEYDDADDDPYAYDSSDEQKYAYIDSEEDYEAVNRLLETLGPYMKAKSNTS